MNQEIQKKIFEYIDALAQKLSVTSEFVWQTLVKQQVVQGWATLGQMIFLLIASLLPTIILSRYTITNWKKIYEKDLEVPMILICVVMSLVAIIILVIASYDIPQSVMKINNPEYYALKELLEAIK